LTDVKGIGPASAKKLREAGIATAADIMKQTPEGLAKVLGFSLGRTREIIKTVMELP
jgi:predicted flap endonuclease-1-like 5' DNA nuclease